MAGCPLAGFSSSWRQNEARPGQDSREDSTAAPSGIPGGVVRGGAACDGYCASGASWSLAAWLCVCGGGQEYQIPPPPIIWPCLGSWLPSALPSWSSAHLTCPASPPPSKHLHATVCSHCFSPVKFQVSSPPPPLLLLLCLRALLKRRPPNGCPGMPMARVCRLGVSGQHHDTEKCGLLVMVKTIWLLSGIGECRTSALRV